MMTRGLASSVEHARGFALALTRRGAQLRLPQTAGSLAFLSLLALVPVFTIAVSLLGALASLAPLRDKMVAFLASNFFLPSFSETLVDYLNQFATKVGELSLVGAIAFLATAFFAMLTIDRTLNGIWGVTQARSLGRRLSIYWMFLTIGPLLLAATVAVNGIFVSESFVGARLAQVERVWLYALPWITSIGGLTLLYRLVPNAPVRWSEAVAGALVAAIALDLLKRGFAFQIAKLPTYTVVYGAFAALPIFLVWLMLVWLTVLGGALLAASIPYWGAGPGVHLPPSPSRRFELAACALEALIEAAKTGRSTLITRELAVQFEADPGRVEETARLLSALGYIERFWRRQEGGPTDAERAVWDEHWALAPGAGAMTLRPLFECLWGDGAPDRHAVERCPGFDLGRVDRQLVELGGAGVRPAVRRAPAEAPETP